MIIMLHLISSVIYLATPEFLPINLGQFFIFLALFPRR